ncbi:MAG TPA: hypothetical protein DDW52_16380 [Planctomycetaceae bacterium]|nr:hypothetical protein [Planctomycetaceae bacterium]
MLRILGTIFATAALGLAGGKLQAIYETSGFTERFLDSRETEAELNQQISRAELLKQSVGTPKVEVVDGATHDFGSMQHGEERSHVFVFRNTGDGPLNLTMGGSTCKCTVGDLKQSILAPGEETEVKLTWTAKSLLREFGQSATIITTDPTQTEVKLVVKGQIVSSFTFEPEELALGEIQNTAPVTKKIMLMNYLSDETKIENLVWSNDKHAEHIKLEHQTVPLDASKYPKHKSCKQVHEITMTIEPGIAIGPLSGRIQVETDMGENLEDVEIDIEGSVTGPVSLMGGSSLNTRLSLLDFGTVKSSQGASLVVYLRVQPDVAKSFAATAEVVQFGENLTASIGEPTHRKSSSLFPVRIEVPAGSAKTSLVGPKGNNYGKVLIKTNVDSAGEIPIYVRLVVTK